MTAIAGFAASKGTTSDGLPTVGVFADSRETGGTTVRDGVCKLLPLDGYACAVGAGSAEPLRLACTLATERLRHEAALASIRGDRVTLWKQAGFFFGALAEARLELGCETEHQALVAGFLSGGSPAIASGTLNRGGYVELYLYKPQAGEIVARAGGSRAVHGVVAEAMRMSAARRCDFSPLMSVLHDIAALGDTVAEDDEPLGPTKRVSSGRRLREEAVALVEAASPYRGIGGIPSFGICRLGEEFSYPAFAIDGGFYRMGQRLETRPADAVAFGYEPEVFRRLEAMRESGTLFSGGAPRASLLRCHPLVIATQPVLFVGEEPEWAHRDEAEVPVVFGIPDGPFAAGENRPASGLTPEEAASIMAYRSSLGSGARRRR